jgi:hypothetical protein
MSFEQQRWALLQKFAQFGWTSIFVEPDERSLSWAYTMGMIGAGHPELVVVDEPMTITNELFATLAPEVLAGHSLDAGSTFDLAGRTWAVLPVHRSHVRTGLLGWWEDIVPHCSCHAEPPAVQLIDAEMLGSIDEAAGVRLDRRFERQPLRAQRRREDRRAAKRRGSA